VGMSAKWAEKLAVLVEQTDVLLDQAYNVKQTLLSGQGAPAFLADKRWKSTTERLIKRFPEAPIDINDADNALILEHAHELIAELAPYVDCFAAVEEVGREIVALLGEILSHSIDLKWGTNSGLVAGFLTLLTRYAQLNILASGVGEETVGAMDLKTFRRSCRVILAAHAKARESLGEYEDRFSATAAYLRDLVEQGHGDVIIFLQEKLQPALRQKLGPCLMTLVDALHDGIDWDGHQSIRPAGGAATPFEQAKKSALEETPSQQLFSVQAMLQGDVMTKVPTVQQSQRLECVATSATMVQWVVYAFLVCPDELASRPHFELFRTCLHQGTALSVYRDEYLDIHERLKAVDKLHRLDKQWQDLTKDKKYLSDTKHHSRDKAAGWHRHRRTALVLEMGPMVDFFLDMPTLTGPKAELLMSVLRRSRDEITWYFRNLTVPDSKDWPPKHWTEVLKKTPEERRDWELHHVSDLIYWHGRISKLLLDNRRTIAAYWSGMMQQVYSAEIAVLLASEEVGAVAKDLRIKQILDSNLATLAGCTADTDFSPLRLNWERTVAFWSSKQSTGCNINHPAAVAVYSKMNRIAEQSKFVDSMGSLLDETSLEGLFWFRRVYRDLYRVCLDFRRPVASIRHSVAFVQHISSFANCVPPHFAAEREGVGAECAEMSQRMLQSVAETAQILVDHINKEANVLYDEVSAENAVQGERTGDRAEMRSHSLARVGSLQQQLSLLGAAVAEAPRITIHDRTFYPREFLRMRLATAVRQQLWDSSWFDTSFERMQRPTVIKEELLRYARALSTLEEVVGIDVSEMLRAVLTSVSYTPELSKLFPSDERQQFCVRYLRPPAEGELSSLPLCIAKWMVNLLGKVGTNGSIQYSDFFAGLVSGPLIDGDREPDPRDFRAEEFCEIGELEAICTLVGPYGVQVIEHELLHFIKTQAIKLAAWMAARELPLDMFARAWETEAQAQQFAEQLHAEADEFVTAGVNVGLALCLRRQLHAALKHTVASGNGQLLQCVEMSHMFASNGLRLNAAVRSAPELQVSFVFVNLLDIFVCC
jgi:hypothetical protein